MRRVLRSAVSCCALAHGAMGLYSGIAAAQPWPAKPVRVIAPFAAGGTADTLGRIVSGKLGESLGQSFVVENRAGAGGLVGSEIVSKSAPDGYTLGVSGVASHVVAPMLSKAPFDPLKDFTHIALFGGPPTVLALHPSLPAPDLKAFIALAKARPAELTYGSPGNGTHGHLIAELLKRTAGIDMRHVPYKGASIAVVDVTAGHIHAISTTLSTAAPQIRARRLRALAASSVGETSRLSATADVQGARLFAARRHGMVRAVRAAGTASRDRDASRSRGAAGATGVRHARAHAQ